MVHEEVAVDIRVYFISHLPSASASLARARTHTHTHTLTGLTLHRGSCCHWFAARSLKAAITLVRLDVQELLFYVCVQTVKSIAAVVQ